MQTEYKFDLSLRVSEDQARQAETLYRKLYSALENGIESPAFPDHPEIEQVYVEMAYLGIGCGLAVNDLGEGSFEIRVSDEGVEDPYPYPTLALLQFLVNDFDLDPREPVHFSWSTKETAPDGRVTYGGGGALVGAGRDTVHNMSVESWLQSEAEDFKNGGYGIR